MPMPVSITAMRIRPGASTRGARTHCSTTSTWPRSVNLTELPTRLASTWRIRCSSPMTRVSVPGWATHSIRTSLASADCANSATVSSATSSSENGRFSSAMRPASMREKSRISLMISSSDLPEISIVCAKRRCESSSLLASNSSVMPSTPFIGVRISWLIVARKRVLASDAASARSFSMRSSAVRASTSRSSSSRWCCSCSSARRRAVMSWTWKIRHGALDCVSEKNPLDRAIQISAPLRCWQRSSIANERDCCSPGLLSCAASLCRSPTSTKSANARPIRSRPSKPSSTHSAGLTCSMLPSMPINAMPIDACVNALWKRLSLASSSRTWRAACAASRSAASIRS